jgi:hypothetical protein
MPDPQTETLTSFRTRWPDRTLVEHVGQHPSSVGDLTLPAKGVAPKAATRGRVNAGRWIADCPDPNCNGAEYVNLDDPVFFCCECRNARADHRLINIRLPDPDTIAAIDAALMARPVPATRNWQHGETVDDLLAENADNVPHVEPR